MHLCERKKNFIKIPALIYIWSYEHWFSTDLEFWCDSVGGKIRYVSDTLHRYINIGKAETFKVTMLPIAQRDIQSMEQEISFAKEKPHSPIQNCY